MVRATRWSPICPRLPGRSATKWRHTIAVLALLDGVLRLSLATAQELPPWQLPGVNVQRYANGVLTLMAFSVVPDLTSSFLSIDSGQSSSPSISMSQLGGGFTLSTGFALYLEGSLGYNRYDPTFIATRGEETRRIPAKWNTVAVTGGIGWDFPLYFDGLYLRPIFNFSFGHVESDASLVGRLVDYYVDADVEYLRNGRLNAYGLGGALMLDYMRYVEAYDLDVELRYTNILLQSFDTSTAVTGSAQAEAVSLYTRLRLPTGLVFMRRPLRYVFELANTTYLGDQAGALGFNYLTSLGAGIELDTSAINLWISRVRFVGRYVIGENVNGASFGISVS